MSGIAVLITNPSLFKTLKLLLILTFLFIFRMLKVIKNQKQNITRENRGRI